MAFVRYDKKGYRTGAPGWESIPELLKRFTNTGSGHFSQYLDAHGLGKALDDGKEGVGGQHRRLYTQHAQPSQTRVKGESTEEGTLIKKKIKFSLIYRIE